MVSSDPRLRSVYRSCAGFPSRRNAELTARPVVVASFRLSLAVLLVNPRFQAKQELGTLFGNNAENTAVGITGNVEFVCLDGPSVVVRLSGRFWHEKTTVSRP